MPPAHDTSAVGGLFLRDGDSVAELAVQDFATEDELQALIADHPEMLAGPQIDPEEPRRFLLIRREAPVAGMSLDHLFIDQDAVPTLVEVKRSTDTRSRREVVAQMLDYAANAAGEWNERLLREWLVERTGQADAASAMLAELEAPAAADPDRFWEQVDQNLRDGKVRLISLPTPSPPGCGASSSSSTSAWSPPRFWPSRCAST